MSLVLTTTIVLPEGPHSASIKPTTYTYSTRQTYRNKKGRSRYLPDINLPLPNPPFFLLLVPILLLTCTQHCPSLLETLGLQIY